MVECTYGVESMDVERVHTHTVRSNKHLDGVTYDDDSIIAYRSLMLRFYRL